MRFINRERELTNLDSIHGRSEAQFVVVYGRRRIGKTALLINWLKKRQQSPDKGIYWVAHKSSSEILLKSFSNALKPVLPGISEDFVFASWENLLEQLFELSANERIVVVIDEFPYLQESVSSFCSYLQIVWDRHAPKSNLMLILCGSHYHMMYDAFLSGNGPLYGRSTADLLVEEIKPQSLKMFLPKYSFEQIVETYAIIGGVPKYLEMWDDSKPVLENVRNVILSPVTIFRQEAIYLIQEEITEPRTYLAILEAMGAGLRTPSQISQTTGIAINHIGKYLSVLLDLGFVRKVSSLDVQDVNKTRKNRYCIKDAYLKFYFTYIAPNLSLIEQKRTGRLIEIIKSVFTSYVGKNSYEALARQLLTDLGDTGQLSFIPDYIGHVWDSSVEIDVFAINKKDKNTIIGECKWQAEKINESVLDQLISRASHLRKLDGFKKQYALFSRSGFTKSLLQRSKKEEVLLFHGLEPIEA